MRHLGSLTVDLHAACADHLAELDAAVFWQFVGEKRIEPLAGGGGRRRALVAGQRRCPVVDKGKRRQKCGGQWPKTNHRLLRLFLFASVGVATGRSADFDSPVFAASEGVASAGARGRWCCRRRRKVGRREDTSAPVPMLPRSNLGRLKIGSIGQARGHSRLDAAEPGSGAGVGRLLLEPGKKFDFSCVFHPIGVGGCGLANGRVLLAGHDFVVIFAGLFGLASAIHGPCPGQGEPAS